MADNRESAGPAGEIRSTGGIVASSSDASEQPQGRRIRVAVVFGGRGPEHPISCLGGGNVLRVIDRERYEVIPIGITTEGAWLEVADDPAKLAITGGELPTVESVAKPDAHVVPWAYRGDSSVVAASAPGHIPHVLGDVDVVLPVLHGPYGEDGTIQGLLEMSGVPYVGAGVLASAVSMDKEYMKLIFQARGLPVGPYVVVRDSDWPAAETPTTAQARVAAQIDALGWPLFVKPARGGSSLGTSKASDPDELADAIALARRFDPKVLVEAAITAREIEVAVLQGRGGAAPDTSLPGELRLDGGEEFYDFEAKYLDQASGMLIPAPIPSEDVAAIRELAGRVFDAVSGEGLARVDFFYTADNQILVNEINTFPGMSPTSYFQKMWEATGLSFPQVIDRLLETALAKRPGLR
jgi:D-alanine-D-alanine ligase